MYTLRSSLLHQDGSWREVDVLDLSFKSLYDSAKHLYLNLYEHIWKQQVVLDLNTKSFRKTHRYSTQTVGEFLIANGDTLLPTTPGEKSLTEIRRHHYLDRATEPTLTHTEPTVMGYGYSATRPLSKAPDLNLTNYPDAYKYCIATCAGLAHIIKPTPQGSCIVDGNASLMGYKDNAYGLHDFRELGTIRQFTLRDELVSISGDSIILNLEEDLTNKLVFLSINGSLLLLDHRTNAIRTHSVHSIIMDTTKISWKSLILSTQRYINLDHLELDRVIGGDSSVAVANLTDMNMIKRMLLGPRSFAVVLTPHDPSAPFGVDENQFFDLGLRTGSYTGGELAPAGIMLNDRDQVVNYINQRQDDIYVIHTNQYRSFNYAHETTEWQDDWNIDDSRLMSHKLHQASVMRNLNCYQLK